MLIRYGRVSIDDQKPRPEMQQAKNKSMFRQTLEPERARDQGTDVGRRIAGLGRAT
jgi:hypothetical protein